MLVILRERLFEPQAFFLYLYLEPGNVILGILFRRFEERHDIPAADGNVIALVPFKATGIRWHDLLVIRNIQRIVLEHMVEDHIRGVDHVLHTVCRQIPEALEVATVNVPLRQFFRLDAGRIDAVGI